MTTDSQATATAQPRLFGQPRYVLPDTVHTNISRQHYDGAPGLWAYARGLLVETSHAPSWTPVALYVRVCTDSSDNTTAVVLTLIARDENNQIVTVVWRQEHGTGDRTSNGWQFTIDGVVPHQSTGRLRPSPSVSPTSSAAPSTTDFTARTGTCGVPAGESPATPIHDPLAEERPHRRS
jgi:hypothetical protein